MIRMLGCLTLLGSFALAASPTWQKIQSQIDKLSDGQVLGALTAANDGELDAAKLAQSKAQDPQVKGFAQHMLADHSANNDQVGALARQLNVSPQTSAASANLTADAKAEAQALQAQTGAAFDKAYIDRQVQDHQTVLDLIQKTLLPSASSAELQNLLTKTRDTVSQHLQSAKTIQQQLAGKR